ncbi:MAG: hypothetical protein ACR2LC_02945 [Pyrinomonadaceae bacterium]
MTTEEMIEQHSRPLALELDYADDTEASNAAQTAAAKAAVTTATATAATTTHEATETTSKKEQIIALYESGTTDIAQIVRRISARPSYVAQVLQGAGFISGYFDLYTTTAREQNVYSRFFRNVLQFKTVEAAQESVLKIDRLFNYFERLGDRAGQHQAMVVALTGKNRARWSNKHDAAQVFNEWLASH